MSRRHKIDEALLFALHIATRPNGPATAKGIALLEEALRLNFHCKCGEEVSIESDPRMAIPSDELRSARAKQRTQDDIDRSMMKRAIMQAAKQKRKKKAKR